MSLRIKAWLVSQGLLLVTATLIQLTFYREIKVGPILGMEKRPYVDIILGKEPTIPDFVLDKNLPPKLYDGRLALSDDEVRKANLGAYRMASRQEEGLRVALWGGLIVNLLYLLAYHLLFSLFLPCRRRGLKKREVCKKISLLCCHWQRYFIEMGFAHMILNRMLPMLPNLVILFFCAFLLPSVLLGQYFYESEDSSSFASEKPVVDYYEKVDDKSFYQQKRIHRMKGDINSYSARLHDLQDRFDKILRYVIIERFS